MRTLVGVTKPVEPLDVDGVRTAAVGTIIWAVALLVTVVLHGRLSDDGRGWWVWAAATGTLLGGIGIWFLRRRRARYSKPVSTRS